MGLDNLQEIAQIGGRRSSGVWRKWRDNSSKLRLKFYWIRWKKLLCVPLNVLELKLGVLFLHSQWFAFMSTIWIGNLLGRYISWMNILLTVLCVSIMSINLSLEASALPFEFSYQGWFLASFLTIDKSINLIIKRVDQFLERLQPLVFYQGEHRAFRSNQNLGPNKIKAGQIWGIHLITLVSSRKRCRLDTRSNKHPGPSSWLR